MDRKTAYTRTFLELLEQPTHDESIKTNYYTWWQNVRESYQARSLRLTKQGLEMIEKIDIKTYDIKFPAKVIFTPQTYLWLDEFVDCPLLRGQEEDHRDHGENGSTTDAFRRGYHKIRSCKGNEQDGRTKKSIKLRLFSHIYQVDAIHISAIIVL